MSEFSDLADVLSYFMERAGVGDERLATLVNELVGKKVGRDLTKRSSIQNWREGKNRRSRRWQPLIAIAIVLKLSQRETNLLLQFSFHPTIAQLWSKAKAKDQIILKLWDEARQERQEDVLQEIAQDSIDQEKPAKITRFQGREDEIKWVMANLKPGKVVVLYGPGGIGKTAVAIEVVYRLTPENKPPQEFPDGLLFHNFYEHPQASQAFQHVASRFSPYRSDSVPGTREAAQKALAGKQVLLVLDGSENAEDLDSIISIRGNCGVLITSQVRIDADARRNIEALPKLEAEKLLKTWAGARADTQAAIEEICDLVGRLPLAIPLIGSYLDNYQINATEYLPLLRDGRLESLDLDARQQASVLHVLKKSTEALSNLARLTLALSGLLGFASFSTEVIAAGHDLPLTEVYAPLGELVRTSLLERPKERYRPIHILIHQYAQTHLSDVVNPDHITRLMAYFSTLAQTETEQGGPGLARLAPEQSHILAVLYSGKNQKLWEPCLTLSARIDEYLDLRGQWEDRIKVNEIGQAAAQELGSEFEQGQALIRLGMAHFQSSQWQKAEEALREGLAVAERFGNQEMRAWAELNLGNLCLRRNQFEQAQAWYERCLETSQYTGNKLNQAKALNGLGNCHSNRGNIQEAVAKYEKCLQAFQVANGTEPNKEMAKALDNLATCYRRLGDFEQAIARHQRALAIFQAAGDLRAEILTIMRMGNVYLEKENFVQAISWYERARKQSQIIKDRYTLNMILINLGITYRQLKQYDKAEAVLIEAKQNAEALNDGQRLGGALNSLGQFYRVQGQFKEAIDHYQAALTLFRNIGNADDEGTSLSGLADTYLAMADYPQAADYYNQAFTIFEHLGLVRGKLYVLKGLGLVCQAQSQDQQARIYWQQGLNQCQPEWPGYKELTDLLQSLDK